MTLPRSRAYDGKYRQVADEAWVAEVLKFPPGPTPEGRRYRGVCPRCDHQLDIVVELQSGVTRPSIASPPTADISALRRRPSERTITQTIFCNCTEKHEDRDKDERGCGIYGDVTVRLRATEV